MALGIPPLMTLPRLHPAVYPQISTLMQKFAEVRNERTTPVQVLRRVLDLVVADCHASFAS